MKSNYKVEQLANMSPDEFRQLVRRGEWTGDTSGVCRNHGRANLIALPREFAFEFLLFCVRNPRPCCVSDVTEAGDPRPMMTAPNADLRSDLPRYRVYKNGEVIAEPFEIGEFWRDDLVSFLIGFASVQAFDAAGVAYRFLGSYTTNIKLNTVGRFAGNMVCTCFTFPTSDDAVKAVQISSRYLDLHGAPVHIGDGKAVGVEKVGNPDAWIPPWETPPPAPHEVVMFFGCGITPQNVITRSKIPYAVTHYPGCMFIIDKRVEELAIL